jgi:hypothetical protein
MSEFNLATADKHQLKFHAKKEYDMNLSLSMTETTMRERIQKHCEDNDIDAPVARVDGKQGKSNVKYITINIAKQDKKGGAEPAFVGVQGVGYTIPRGINVAVPLAVVEVLKNAKQDIVTQDSETGEIHKEEVLTHPFQIVSGGN